MQLKRPNLNEVPPDVKTYIEALEAEIERLQSAKSRRTQKIKPEALEITEASEPPTTINVLTLTRNGTVKRTPRHLYSRQRRGGMGVFDIEAEDASPPIALSLVDESQTLIVFSTHGRAYRLSASKIPQTPVRARGVNINSLLPLRQGEHIVATLPDEGGKHIALVSERGWINLIRPSFIGPNMIQGVSHLDANKRGALVSACWTQEGGDLFIATRQGKAIRFAQRQVAKSGCLGIRTDRDDQAVSVTWVTQESGVFLLSADGKGSIRLMSGFRANKMPGSGGKIALKTDALIGAMAVDTEDDIFIISHNSKIIRFRAIGVPQKTGAVQGVSCMALRGDETTALAVAKIKNL